MSMGEKKILQVEGRWRARGAACGALQKYAEKGAEGRGGAIASTVDDVHVNIEAAARTPGLAGDAREVTAAVDLLAHLHLLEVDLGARRELMRCAGWDRSRPRAAADASAVGKSSAEAQQVRVVSYRTGQRTAAPASFRIVTTALEISGPIPSPSASVTGTFEEIGMNEAE